MLVFFVIIAGTLIGFAAFIHVHRKYGDVGIFVGPIIGVIATILIGKLTGLII